MIEETRRDIDADLVQYSTRRPDKGRIMNDRTPEQMFVKGRPRLKKPVEELLAEFLAHQPAGGGVRRLPSLYTLDGPSVEGILNL